MRGQLALAAFDMRGDAACLLDAVVAIIANSPGDVLEKLDKELVMKGAMAYPDRETWGLLPEHQRMAGNLVTEQPAPAIAKIPRGDGR